MLSKKFSLILSSLTVTLLTSGSYPSLAGDASAKGRVSDQYASGATSANLPHNFFNQPQSADVRNKPNVPHGIPAGGHNKPGHTTTGDTHPSQGTTTHSNPSKVDCPPGHEKGWIITEDTHRYMILADGTKIDLDHSGGTHHADHHSATSSHSGSTHHSQHGDKPGLDHSTLHPEPTPEELALEAKLKPVASHIFKRADPHNPTAEKRGEWGKALDGKVLGIWKHDPSVNATTDIISTGVKDKIKASEASTKGQHSKPEEKPAADKPAADKPAEDKPATDKPTDDNKPMNIPKAPPPPPKGGPKPAIGGKPVRKAPTVVPPDVVGTTGRTNTVQTDPTQGDKRVMSQGAANRAQTGLTGQEIPPADTSETGNPVPPPSGSTTPAD
jgi:hypothetical protein